MKAVHLAEHPKKANEKNPTIQENKFIDILSKVATVVAIFKKLWCSFATISSSA